MRLKVIFGTIFVLSCAFLLSGCTQKSEESAFDSGTDAEQQESNETIGEEVDTNEVEDNPADESKTIVPEWFNQTYRVNSSELDGLSNQDVRLWESYEDRNFVIAIPRYSDVILKGYRSDYDYCQLEYERKIGWTACAWIENLPEDMVDYWE